MDREIPTAAPLLMLPGLMCDGSIFSAQIAGNPQAAAVSGYGLSDTIGDMAKRVLKKAPPRFSLLGHSMGARVALEIVRRAPDRVERLALVSTGVHTPQPGEAEKRHALRDLGRRHGMDALIDAWLPPMVAPAHRHNRALMDPLRAMCIAAGLATFDAQVAALLNRPEVQDLLPEIHCPTLVAAGSEDIWSPPVQHHSIASAISGATYREISGAGHMLPAEAPDALNCILLDWLGAKSPGHIGKDYSA